MSVTFVALIVHTSGRNEPVAAERVDPQLLFHFPGFGDDTAVLPESFGIVPVARQQTVAQVEREREQLQIQVQQAEIRKRIAELEAEAEELRLSTLEQRLRNYPQAAAYETQRAQLEIARALAGEGIRVNAVAPGAITTEVMLTAIGRTTDQLDQMLADWNIPLGRLGTPQDIGAACVYLASDAASWVSGETVRVGGGARPR